LAADPLALLQASELEPNKVISQWEPYQALQPQFILARARAILSPPESVSLRFENGVLSASGTAPLQWIEEARRLARAVPGVIQFKEKELFDSGSQVREQKFEELMIAKEQLEKETVLFKEGTADFVPGQETTFNRLVETMRTLFEAARITGKKVGVEIVGHQDTPASPSTKQPLSLTRAERVLAELVAMGLSIGDLEAVKTRAEEQHDEEVSKEGQALNRRVSFAMIFFGARTPGEQASPP
jgi:OOP family OmpA-OmpF porin